jgi:hypothetical protein
MEETNTRAVYASRERFVGILFLAAIPGYFACVPIHLCVGGHMEHPPYPAIHWLLDASWVLLFSASAVMALATRSRRRYWYLVGTVFLVTSRIISLGMLNSMLALIQLPVILILSIVSIGHIWTRQY